MTVAGGTGRKCCVRPLNSSRAERKEYCFIALDAPRLMCEDLQLSYQGYHNYTSSRPFHPSWQPDCHTYPSRHHAASQYLRGISSQIKCMHYSHMQGMHNVPPDRSLSLTRTCLAISIQPCIYLSGIDSLLLQTLYKRAHDLLHCPERIPILRLDVIRSIARRS